MNETEEGEIVVSSYKRRGDGRSDLVLLHLWLFNDDDDEVADGVVDGGRRSSGEREKGES